ncbi:hypothetical protein M8542_36600 [Amycolatopsis sp. OK19-0408]|uniref:Uncharacterized protein n=1 Tax=Amycolatopsis iheyensis TaxID=2945988 RepID=A0A9X2SQB3_9PSEU|nr:hypothetical protein [Amycolatopsis iheyensis]MCR6488365.1 hypothetical protein [Amycolatopsis iheyensis]
MSATDLGPSTAPLSGGHAEAGIPVILDVVGLATALIDRGAVLSAEELTVALFRVPGDEGPVLLDALHRHRLVTDLAVSRVVGLVWSSAEYPDRVLTRTRWRVLFAAAGYTEDGHQVPRPTGPQQLYRGSVADRRADWSWTDCRDVARAYAAGGFGGRLPGAIWTATVSPERLLARNHERDEFEYVVDTTGLTIEPVPGCAAFAAAPS